jgi:hypothetical protein
MLKSLDDNQINLRGRREARGEGEERGERERGREGERDM